MTDYRLVALKHINDGIKAAKPLKVEAYEQGQHKQCAEYKSLGIHLSTIKALTILEMEQEGTVAKGNISIQHNSHGDTLLTEYHAGGYSYHLISASEPDTDAAYPEYVAASDTVDYVLSPCIVAYQNYLYNRLSSTHKKIADLFVDGSIWLGKRTIDMLSSLNIIAPEISLKNEYHNVEVYNIVFALGNTVLCRVPAYLSTYYDILSVDDYGHLELLEYWDVA